MTLLHAGSELDAFSPLSSSTIESTAVAAAYDAAKSRCAIRLGLSSANNTMGILSPVFASQTTAWFHAEVYLGAVGSSAGWEFIQLINSSGTTVFKLQVSSPSATVFRAQYWNGSSYVTVGSDFALPIGTRFRLDIKVVCGASGSFEIYTNGALLVSGAIASASTNNIARYRVTNIRSDATVANQSFISQVFIKDTDTRANRLYTKPPTAAGALTAWSGAVSDINETVLNDADFISSATANQKCSYTGAALSLGPDAVEAVIVSSRSLRGGAGPQNLNGLLRIAGTDYVAAVNVAPDLAFNPCQTFFAVDPSTGLPWTPANASAATLEFGLQSLA